MRVRNDLMLGLYRIFRADYGYLWNKPDPVRIPSCTTNQLYKKALKISPINLEYIGLRTDIPVVVANILEDNRINKDDVVIIPLNECRTDVNSAITPSRAMDIVFGGFIYTYHRIVEMYISRYDITYFVSHGLILDKDLNPLILCAHSYRVEEINGRGINILNNPALYINPTVMVEKDPMSAYIRKAIIPFYSEAGNVPVRDAIGLSCNKPVDIIISDTIKDFFVEPSYIRSTISTEESINNFLINHIDDIKYQMFSK